MADGLLAVGVLGCFRTDSGASLGLSPFRDADAGEGAGADVRDADAGEDTGAAISAQPTDFWDGASQGFILASRCWGSTMVSLSRFRAAVEP